MLIKLNSKLKRKKRDGIDEVVLKKRKVRSIKGKPITILKISRPGTDTSIKKVTSTRKKKKRLDTEFKIAKRYNEKIIQDREWVEVKEDTKWECIRCGWCCTHNWRVNLTWQEYDRLKVKIPITEIVVDEKTGMSHPFFEIKNKCICYDPDTKKCTIWRDRAYSCATFPFSLTPDGDLVRSKFCKGFDHGKKVEKKKMIKYILKWRKKAGMSV
jgi:Fe-S-cluster containining protein